MQLSNPSDLLRDYRLSLSGFQSRIDNHLTILLYHGVTDSHSIGIENDQGKHISAIEFRNQMKYISKNCHLLSIDDFLNLQKNGDNLPPRSVIVSFDDGFHNNYSTAAPILEKLYSP